MGWAWARGRGIGLPAVIMAAACVARPPQPTAVPHPPPSPTTASPAATDDAGPVHGIVVDRDTRRPIGNCRVSAGSAGTGTTDAGGAFTLAAVPATYDLVVVDDSRAAVSIYRGLRRRDPLLVHDRARRAPTTERPRRARVRGTLGFAGGAPPPAPGRLAGTVAFLSADAEARAEIDRAAEHFGPLSVNWEGKSQVSGELVALLTNMEATSASAAPPQTGAADAGVGATKMAAKTAAKTAGWGARQTMTLGAQDVAIANLTLESLPAVTLTATLQSPPGWSIIAVRESYVLPVRPPSADASASTPAAGVSVSLLVRQRDQSGLRSLHDEIPDLSVWGGTLCVSASADDAGTATTTACGFARDQPLTLTVQAPPRLSEPPLHGTFEAGTRFSWSRFDNGVHVLEWRTAAVEALAANVTLYTTDTTTRWQDLPATGVPFPRPCAVYSVTVGGRGPYASMDAAFGRDGIGAAQAREARASRSVPIDVQVPRWPTPLPGTPDARLCHYPYGQGITCGSGEREFYVLSAINNKLRHFAEFAAAIGIFCVRDCETARRFSDAYRAYLKAHPDFDANWGGDMEDC